MNLSDFRKLVKEWDLSGDTDLPGGTSKYTQIANQLEYFAKTEWKKYVPTWASQQYSHDYMHRLAGWIGNLDDDDERKILFEYAARIAYFTDEDFFSLYNSAYHGPISRWVIDQARLKFNDPNYVQQFRSEMQKTWFCPVTDSMLINEFYKVNGIQNAGERFQFDTLATLGANQQNILEVNKQMQSKGLARLVLLEDFVGSGSQVTPGIEWALNHLKINSQPVPTLFAPLIVCSKGATDLRHACHRISASSPGLFSFCPILELTSADALGPGRDLAATSSDPLLPKIEALAKSTFPRVAGKTLVPSNEAPYGPFGFADIGCSIVHRLNAPDNSLPLIHHKPKTGTWKPLFPRIARV